MNQPPRHSARRRHVRRLLAGAWLLASLSGSTPADAQQFGRWWWEGGLDARRRGYDNSLAGEPVSSFDETELALRLGINGFILHPAIAQFRLGVEAGLNNSESVTRFDTRRWGFDAGLRVLPRGAYPLSLYARRRLLSYPQLQDGDPLLRLGVPSTSTAFGGRLRLRRGWLAGTLLGFDASRLAYEIPAGESNGQSNAFAQWNGQGRKYRRHLRLDRRHQDFGLVDYRTRDLTLRYDQRGEITPGWRWDWTSFAIRRELESRSRRSTLDNLRMTQLLVHRLRGNDTLDLRYDGGLSGGAGFDAQTHAVQARYWWRSDDAWTVSPFLGYAVQIVDDATLSAPQLGSSATWNTRVGSVQLSTTGGLALRLAQRAEAIGSDTGLAADLGLSLRHGADRGLRKTLDFTWALNRLRFAGEVVPELPDLGSSALRPGTENLFRGRLTLDFRWRSIAVHTFGEAQRRSAPVAPEALGGSLDTLNYTLQLTRAQLSVTTNLSAARVRGAEPQTVDNWSAALRWRPLRRLSLTALYRGTSRETTLVPSLDTSGVEVRADLGVGAFRLSGLLFRNANRGTDVLERVNDGFTLTIGRRFGGWLPFVTGHTNVGTIR